MSHNLSRAAVSLAAFAAASPHVACSQENCDLRKPPPDSAATENHGQFLFVFPRSVPPSYSGCQTTWDEHGAVSWVLRFERGDLVEFQAIGEGGFSCRYDWRKLVEPPAAGCPEYEAVQNEMTIPQGYEPPVPPDRDARR